MITVQQIQILQRLLNPAALERLAANLGVQIPVGQMIAVMIGTQIPAGGDLIVEKINQGYRNFLTKPAQQIYNELITNTTPTVWNKRLCMTILGAQLCWGSEEEKTRDLLLLAGAIVLIGFLLIK